MGLPTQILAEPIDGSRAWRAGTSSTSAASEGVQRSARTRRVGLFVDVLNLLNDDAYDDVGSRLGTSEPSVSRRYYVLPRRVMLGARFHF